MKDKSEETINSVIGQGSAFKGTAEIQGSVRIDGEVEGSLAATESIIVGKTGVVRASVGAKSLVVGGKIVGNVAVSKRIELESGSRLEGDVTTSSLVIAEGVFFQGNCRMDGAASKDGEAPRGKERASSVGVGG